MNTSRISHDMMPHSATNRRTSNNSFGGIYDAIEDALFLELARDVFEDDDEDKSVTLSTECSSDSASVSEFEDGAFERFPVSPKAVSFGFVSVCEFQPEGATILTSKNKTEAVRKKIPLSIYECSKVLRIPLKHTSKRRRNLQVSKQQIGHLQIPSIDCISSFHVVGDSQPRYPMRSLDKIVKSNE